MKRIFSLILLGISTIFLVACSNQNSLDGEYYWINEHRNEVAITFDGDAGEWNEDDGLTITDVDEDNKQFTYQGSLGTSTTVNYTLSDDGVLQFDDYTYYKKDSESYNQALKEYGYDN